MTTQCSALSGAWEGISNGPQRTASCPPMLGSREDISSWELSHTSSAIGHKDIWPIWGECSSLWRLDLTLEIINFSVSPVGYPTSTSTQKSSHSLSSHYSDGTKRTLDLKQNLPIPITIGFTLYPNSGRMYSLQFHKVLPHQTFCKHPEFQALTRFAVW